QFGHVPHWLRLRAIPSALSHLSRTTFLECELCAAQPLAFHQGSFLQRRLMLGGSVFRSMTDLQHQAESPEYLPHVSETGLGLGSRWQSEADSCRRRTQ